MNTYDTFGIRLFCDRAFPWCISCLGFLFKLHSVLSKIDKKRIGSLRKYYIRISIMYGNYILIINYMSMLLQNCAKTQQRINAYSRKYQNYDLKKELSSSPSSEGQTCRVNHVSLSSFLSSFKSQYEP